VDKNFSRLWRGGEILRLLGHLLSADGHLKAAKVNEKGRTFEPMDAF
jgi:hypothetical protein